MAEEDITIMYLPNLAATTEEDLQHSQDLQRNF